MNLRLFSSLVAAMLLTNTSAWSQQKAAPKPTHNEEFLLDVYEALIKSEQPQTSPEGPYDPSYPEPQQLESRQKQSEIDQDTKNSNQRFDDSIIHKEEPQLEHELRQQVQDSLPHPTN